MVETSKIKWNDEKRDHVKERAIMRKRIKVGLFFPGHSCDDLDKQLAIQQIDKKSFLIIVEGDTNIVERKKNLKKIRKFLADNKLTNFHIHGSRVHTLNLKRILKGRKIELLFFDICGNYTAEIANWFNKYQDCFAYKMRLPLTLAIHQRGPRKTGKCNFFKAMDKVSNATLKDLGLDGIENTILDAEEIQCLNLLPDIRDTLKSIYYSFSRRKIKFSLIHPYRFSRTNMVGFVADIMAEKDEDTTFAEIAQIYNKKACPQKRIRKTRKTRTSRKAYARKPVVLKTAFDIARHMGIFGEVASITELPQGKRAWITIHSNRAGLNSYEVSNQIEKRLSKYGLKA